MVLGTVGLDFNGAVRIGDEPVVRALHLEPLDRFLRHPCHTNLPYLLMELIIRTPKCKGEIAGNADIARLQTAFDNGARQRGLEQDRHAPAEVIGTGWGTDKVVGMRIKALNVSRLALFPKKYNLLICQH